MDSEENEESPESLGEESSGSIQQDHIEIPGDKHCATKHIEKIKNRRSLLIVPAKPKMVKH